MLRVLPLRSKLSRRTPSAPSSRPSWRSSTGSLTRSGRSCERLAALLKAAQAAQLGQAAQLASRQAELSSRQRGVAPGRSSWWTAPWTGTKAEPTRKEAGPEEAAAAKVAARLYQALLRLLGRISALGGGGEQPAPQLAETGAPLRARDVEAAVASLDAVQTDLARLQVRASSGES